MTSLFLSSNLNTNIFQSSVPGGLMHYCTSEVAYTSLILQFWRKIVPLVECRCLTLQACAHSSAAFPRIYLLPYRYSFQSCRKHCRETLLSCSLFLKMKTLLGYRCCCLGNLVTLTLLPTLFTTRFIKCVAAGNQNKTSGRAGCLEMQSPIKYSQIAMFLQATSALYIINHAPGSCASQSLHYGCYTDE